MRKNSTFNELVVRKKLMVTIKRGLIKTDTLRSWNSFNYRHHACRIHMYLFCL